VALKGRTGDSRGFALLIVLWTMALLAFIVAELTASSRTEVKIAQNLVGNAVAQAAADGAVFEAIFKLSNPSEGRRWRLDGRAHLVVIGHSRVRVTLTNEAGRINPNLASEALLEALLRVTGSDTEAAHRLATAIEEWVGRKAVPGGPAAGLAEYRAAGLDYGPPGQPLDTLGELSEVLGITPSVLAEIGPHLTLYGAAQPDPRAADPVVAAALALASPTLPSLPRFAVAAPPPFPLLLTVRIAAAARGPGDARASTLVIARVGSLLPSGYVVLSRKAHFG
jgi:general secretion pathway protein K